MGSSFAFTGQSPLLAISAPLASTCTNAAFASHLTTGVVAAPTSSGGNPCKVVTPLNPGLIEDTLHSLNILSSWLHIVNGLRKGFNVGVRGTPSSSLSFFKNHASAALDPIFISSYIESEMAAGHYLKPYTPQELEETIGFFRTSPFGLVPKPNTNSFCLIQDMSYPRNNPDLVSVNANISADDFPTKWGTFNKTVELILSLPPGCKAATFDISTAYCLMPICPDQQWALCIYWNGYVHIDYAVMFSLTLSAGVFGAVADMLVAVYQASEYCAILKWINNFLVIHFSDDTWSEEDFMELTGRFGVP
ncbi:reverse transcriptase ribonuclease h [Moniliophthora roreri MCA 2997]|uniref:Reverse transcriptase ribonuclease h n=1 Tax=Moniliophthora roreri (strain MCA 2997) TaxID=1381753 RepID=V2XXT5_MONRO|nr:reverse transcriptase ribonuclease h [Moniliophthora roreri MCA 2997]